MFAIRPNHSQPASLRKNVLDHILAEPAGTVRVVYLQRCLLRSGHAHDLSCMSFGMRRRHRSSADVGIVPCQLTWLAHAVLHVVRLAIDFEPAESVAVAMGRQAICSQHVVGRVPRRLLADLDALQRAGAFSCAGSRSNSKDSSRASRQAYLGEVKLCAAVEDVDVRPRG